MKKNNNIKFFIVALVSIFGLLFFYQTYAATVPTLSEGTYLSGQTLSVWPSWSLLGNALGKALPVDPINQLALAGTCATSTNRFCVNDSQCPNNEKCVLHDPNTGWSTADRRFSFACSRDSYAYRYIVASGTNKYIIRARLEDTGLAPGNLNNFIAGFVSTSVVKITEDAGICNFDQEISTLQSGVCGDGRLNPDRGEQCDPPGAISYQAGCVGSIKNLTVCNNACQWIASTTLCSSLSKCGNGLKELGESCDDGNLNGRYNHCNISCTGLSALGRCGNGVVESAYEVCDPGTPGVEKYSISGRENSCSWDCQGWGPYCGDGLVQREYESCDGGQTCSVGGQSGARVCSQTCQKQDDRVVGWWSFERLKEENGGGSFTADDVSAQENIGHCLDRDCPTIVRAKEGNGLLFSSSAAGKKSLRMFHNDTLSASDVLTVEAWINPSSDSEKYQRIFEKGGPDAQTGFALEFNASSTARIVRFSLWKNQHHTAVDSISSIPLNAWTHVAATLESHSGINIAKIYINGNLENTYTGVAGDYFMEKSKEDLIIGASLSPDEADGEYSDFFFGMLDEVKMFNRTLNENEIRDNFQYGWFCNISAAPVVVAETGVCGNGVVDANEACDKGVANNGRACVPAYDHSCSYCAANCQNVIDVQPPQYCGNGIIEDIEKCDYASDGAIFASAAATDGSTALVKDDAHNGYRELTCAEEVSAPHTIKKGVKTCGSCALGTVKSCTVCGINAAGVSVNGGLINILSTSSPSATVKDPLFASHFTSSSIYMSVGACVPITAGLDASYYRSTCDLLTPTSPLVGKAIKYANSDSSYLLANPYGAGNALVSSDPVCSAGEDRSKKYTMYVNRDWARPFDVTVVAAPQTWQYDLVLSPMVRKEVRNKDVRVVVSWVGPEDFIGGAINPSVAASPEINGASFCNTPTTCANSSLKKYATGVTYFNVPNSNLNGIWYHGFNNTAGQTNAESFTIDTMAMSNGTYSFYVKSPSIAIRQFKNTARLKVEVYLPEEDYFTMQLDEFDSSVRDASENYYRFGKPVKTYYFLAAAPSDNQNAKYWQVFNIVKPDSVGQLSIDNILDVSTIVTGPANFNYTSN